MKRQNFISFLGSRCHPKCLIEKKKTAYCKKVWEKDKFRVKYIKITIINNLKEFTAPTQKILNFHIIILYFLVLFVCFFEVGLIFFVKRLFYIIIFTGILLLSVFTLFIPFYLQLNIKNHQDRFVNGRSNRKTYMKKNTHSQT